MPTKPSLTLTSPAKFAALVAKLERDARADRPTVATRQQLLDASDQHWQILETITPAIQTILSQYRRQVRRAKRSHTVLTRRGGAVSGRRRSR